MTTESWNAQGIMISIQGNPLCSRCPDVNRLGLVCRLIELKNQVQLLMEAHLALTQPNQVNKVTTSSEICSGPHDTQYCMEDPKQAFVEYASSRTDEAGGKWYTFKPGQNNLGDTYNSSWRSHPNLRWRQPQNSQNNFSNPPNRFQPNGSISNRSFNNNPQRFNNQSNLEGLVSNFMASQDARLSKFEADFKQQQSEMTNKINTVLKAITDRIARALPSDTVKNPKLSTSPEENISQTSLPQTEMEIETQQPKEPELTLEDEFKDLHLNLPVLEVLAHAPIYNAILDKYVENLELGKNRSAFVQDVEVHIGNLKLLNDFYVIDMKKDPKTPLLVGRGFLGTANAIIDCRMAKIAVGEGITRSLFSVKGVNLGEEEAPYWTTLGKMKSYKPRPNSDGVGARTSYYARKDFLDCHLPEEWKIARDVELNPFKDTLVFRRMVEFLGAIPINLKSNMWESEDLIKNPINWDKPPKNGDGAWHAKIRLIDPNGEEFTKTLQSIPTTRKLSERESPREIIDLDHFYDT
ncbi:MAK10-like protein [Tanacetum coccineum]